MTWLFIIGLCYVFYRDDLSKLEYTSMCIQESMRLYPAVPNISRCLEKDIALPDGRVVQAGKSNTQNTHKITK